MRSLRSIIFQGWFQSGLIGIILFIMLDVAIQYTRNFGFLPTFIILGAFTIPVAFAAYFCRQEYLLDRNIHNGIPLFMASIVFLIGGIMGTLFAGVLEFQLDFDSKTAQFLSAGGIEEVAKLVFPVIIFILGKYRSEVDGLVFGIASGMGFAAFETLGFGLLTLMSYLSNMRDLEQVLVIRGLLAPLGHADWTGLICGAIWHYQGKGKKMYIFATAYFLLAIVLHFLWNIASMTHENIIMYPSYVAIGVLGLFLVFRHLNHAKKKTLLSWLNNDPAFNSRTNIGIFVKRSAWPDCFG
jgi:protease PrsW